MRSLPILDARNCDAIIGFPARSKASVVLGPSDDVVDGPKGKALAGCGGGKSMVAVPPAAAEISM